LAKVNKRSAEYTRKRITTAALNVFSTKGYRPATIREIAERAETSVGGVYLYFRNKEMLYREVISEQAGLFRKQMGPLREQSPYGALRSYILYNLEFAFNKKELVSLHLKDYDLAFMNSFRKAFFNSQKVLVEEILRAGVERGTFMIKDCEHTALLILFAIRGAVTSHVTHGAGDVHKLCDSICSLIGADKDREAARQ
jgi:AcrR family transcriptional regulator